MVQRWIYGTARGQETHQTRKCLALVIDRPILELLKIDPERPLNVSTDGRQLIIAPAKPSARRAKFEAAQELAYKRYGRAFQKLAE